MVREFGTCDCDTPNPVFDSVQSEEICMNCGVVLDHILYDGREWGFDDSGKDVGHVGQAGARLGTIMDPFDRVSKRVVAASADRTDVSERENEGIVDTQCRSLKISSTVISATAKDMFRIHLSAKTLGGETKQAAAAACLYYACRAERANRELRLISSVCQIDMRAMNAAAKTVKDTLRTTAYGPKIAEHNGGIEALVDVFLDRLRLPPDDRRALWRYTTKTLREVEYLFDSGRKPRTIVGGIIYVAAANLHMDIPKKNIMEAAGVCAQTLDKITSSMMTAAA